MKKTLLLTFLLIVLAVLPIQAQQPIRVYLPLILKNDMVSNSYWQIIKNVASSNQVLNPSAETTGNFAALGAAVVTRVTTYQKYGLYSYRVQPGADNDGISLTLNTLANSAHFITARVRGTLPASWDWSLDNVLYVSPNLIEKVDSNWNLYGMPVPANIANGATTLYIRQNGAGSGDFYLDGIQVEPLSNWTSYIDGTQEGCEWLGVAHASTSQRSGESKAGGYSYDFFGKYGFIIKKVVGAGSAEISLNTADYAILPGGVVTSQKIESRDMTIVGQFQADTLEGLHYNQQQLRLLFTSLGLQATRIRYNGSAVQKEIGVFYRSGLEDDLPAFYNDRYIDGDRWAKAYKFVSEAKIQVRADDPYWYEVGESAADLDTTDSETFRIIGARLRSNEQWSSLSPDALGAYTEIFSLVEDDTYVYIGGDFQNFDNIANADHIVRYHKQSGAFSALSTGLNQAVYGMAIGPNGTLYVVGAFTNAGGDANADYVAQWDGAAFSAVGVGADASIRAIAIDLTGLIYVAGDFANIGGVAAKRVAKWNGSAWSALSTGLGNGGAAVYALVVDRNNILYAGGNFTTPTNYIAQWNGSAWSTVGTGGMDNIVYTLAVDNVNNLYAGGFFGTAGGVTTAFIAQWNGTFWKALGSGTDGTVRHISIGPDNTVFAVGEFTTAGSLTSAKLLARWNGYAWAHLDISMAAPNNIPARVTMTGRSDPVVKQNYDIWIGFDPAVASTLYFGGLVSIDNDGSVPVYPKIVYNRSGGTSALIETLKNERTGKELLFDYALLDGETLTIDLSPTKKSITSSMFGLRQDAVLPNCNFGDWALQPGTNDTTSFVYTVGAPTITAYTLWRDAYDSYN